MAMSAGRRSTPVGAIAVADTAVVTRPTVPTTVPQAAQSDSTDVHESKISTLPVLVMWRCRPRAIVGQW
jgi:hypothetical protein